MLFSLLILSSSSSFFAKKPEISSSETKFIKHTIIISAHRFSMQCHFVLNSRNYSSIEDRVQSQEQRRSLRNTVQQISSCVNSAREVSLTEGFNQLCSSTGCAVKEPSSSLPRSNFQEWYQSFIFQEFPPDSFDYNKFTDDCKRQYGVLPRPHWITTYYGGQNIELILKRFDSNIIFSNGLKDPYSSGGVLKNLSDTLAAVTTINGSHCLDILKSNPDDPVWLITQRQTEIKIIEYWIAKYYADLSITRSRLNQTYQRK